MHGAHDIGFSFELLTWAIAIGAISAVSLPLGSAVGLVARPRPAVTGFLAAFGAGALLAALSIELVAPTVAALRRESGLGPALTAFASMMAGCVTGGALFVVLNDMVNSRGGFLRKTATTVTYLAERRKARVERMLHDLAQVPLLHDVPAECVAELVSRATPVELEAGRVIFEQGQAGDRMYFLRSGTVELFIDGEPLAELGGGDVLGEIAVLTGGHRTATARAKDRVEGLALGRKDFDVLRQMSPELDQAARDLASRRIDDLQGRRQSHFAATSAWAHEAADALRTGSKVPSSIELREAKEEHTGAPLAIWLGILLDGIPESFVIGSGFLALLVERTAASQGAALAFADVVPYTLVAGLFLSNFPEALSSSAGMRAQGWSPRRVLLMWIVIMVMTGAGAAVGYLVGESLPHIAVVGIEGVAAGAMLTMIAATMVPEAVVMSGGNLVGLSTLSGFLAAIAFKLLE